MENNRATAKRSRWDTLGISASLLCAIHCAAVPLALVLFPALTLRLPVEDHAFHQVMALLVGTFGLGAFLSGYRKHRRRSALVIASVGLTAILFGGFAHELLGTETHEIERGFTLFGSMVLITAHVFNLRACSTCHHEHSADA